MICNSDQASLSLSLWHALKNCYSAVTTQCAYLQLNDAETNPHVAALANMAYDEIDTPESLARDAKEKASCRVVI